MSRLLDDKQLKAYKKFVPGHTARRDCEIWFTKTGASS
ncbi:MAG: hypothetical protein ACFWT8_13410 [Lacticaseibacillus casei]